MEGELKRATKGQRVEPDARQAVHPTQTRTPNSDQPQVGSMYPAPSILDDSLVAVPSIAGESHEVLDFGAPFQLSKYMFAA
jgi:hypothetical protein